MGSRPYARLVVNHSQNCNMRCTWCHEEGMQGTDPRGELSARQIVETSEKLYRCGVRKFKIVGGEPTLRNDLEDIIAGLRAIDSTIDLSMVTNGSRLATKALAYRDAGVNRINVSLFSLNPRFFKLNVGPTSLMDRVDKGIRLAQEVGILGKLNHVYHNRTELDLVLAYAASVGTRLNVLNRIPSMDSEEFTPVNTLLDLLSTYPTKAVWIEDDPDSLPVTVMQLLGSAEIEVKHLELGEQKKLKSCLDCSVRHKCKEGIFAVRVTPAGELQPCIVRDDNTINALQATSGELAHFLAAL